jgi:hypothetical protein
MMTEMRFHPVSGLFPEMSEAEFEALVADIAANGLREPIHVVGETIIDGRHRYRACLASGIKPRFVAADESADLTALVISLNLHRRHLTESQRAMVGARLATLAPGRPIANPANLPVSQTHVTLTQLQAADALNVSERLVRHARLVQTAGVPELAKAVDSGVIAVSTAADLSQLPDQIQRETLCRSPDEIRVIARDVKTRIKAAGVCGPSAVRIFDQVAQEQGLSGGDQVAVVEVLKADSPVLPTPAEARRIALNGAPGLMVLASDGRYHTAPGDPKEEARFERWLILRDGLEPLGTMPFPPAEAFAAIPAYQKRNVTAWLAHAVPFLNQFNQLWSQHHA